MHERRSFEKPRWQSRVIRVTVVCVFIALSTSTKAAAGDWQLAVTPLAGSYGFDEHLADFKWDARPAAIWGGQASVVNARYAIGTRIWRTQTAQATGFPGDATVLSVNLTGSDLLGAFNLVEYHGFQLWSTAHAGRLHIGYDPGTLSVDIGAPTGPVTVEFKSISEWQVGAGVKLQKTFANRIGVALHGERSSFALDTAHRSGSEIIESRDRFYSWNLRAQVSWFISFN